LSDGDAGGAVATLAEGSVRRGLYAADPAALGSTTSCRKKAVSKTVRAFAVEREMVDVTVDDLPTVSARARPGYPSQVYGLFFFPGGV
jgi:hypothetical protein